MQDKRRGKGMGKKKIKVLVIADGGCTTGFATVSHNIFKNLSPEEYDVSHLAVNYRGDPHNLWWKLYPASLQGDALGYNRIQEFSENDFDLVYILNDIWVIDNYLGLIKQYWKRIPKIICYYPVDSELLPREVFTHSDIVSQYVTYTEFAKKESELIYKGEVKVIAHGVDKETFYPMQATKKQIKSLLFAGADDVINDSFIILNANRNQQRKQTDIALMGFALFAEDKDNVWYFHHAGLKEHGWDVLRLVAHLGIEDKMLYSNASYGKQQIPESQLNLTYNATDVGLNTASGEGWSLTNHEHAVTGAPQIVGDHSALKELYEGVGLLLPTRYKRFAFHGTLHSYTTPEDVAEALNLLYHDRELMAELGKKGQERFSQPQYEWKAIAEEWDNLFKEHVR